MVRSRRQEPSPVRFKASFMAPRGRESTRPAFPKLLAQRTRPFNPNHPLAAFPSLPLMSKLVRQSESIPVRSPSVDLDISDEDNEEVNILLSPSTHFEADTTDSPSNDFRGSSTPVSWSSLELSCQYTIFVELLKQEPDARLIGVALGLNNQEFEEIQSTINERKIHPATVDEIWSFGVALDGIGPSAMAPEALSMYIGYLVRASYYEEVTEEGLVAARTFLRQQGLDIVMTNTFKNQLRGLPDQDTQHVPGARTRNSGRENSEEFPSQKIQSTRRETLPGRRREEAQSTFRAETQSLIREESQRLTSEEVRRPLPKSLQNKRNESLLKEYPEILDVAQTAYSDLPASLRKRLSPQSYNEMVNLVNEYAPDEDQSTGPEQNVQPERHDVEPQTPIQISKHIVTSPGRSLKIRTWNNNMPEDTFRHNVLTQLSSFRNVEERQTSSPSMSLGIDHETGRASIVGLSARQQSLKVSLVQGFSHHRLHDPSAFAAHLVCRGFPPTMRRMLLATDPRMLSTTNFWLVYGNGPGQSRLKQTMGITTPGASRYNPRTIILEQLNIESHALHSLVNVHNQWVQAGVWRTAPANADILSQFERVTVLTLENIRTQEEGDKEEARQLQQQSSEQNDPRLSVDAHVDTAMELEGDDHTIVASSSPHEMNRHRRERERRGPSPETPLYSPISEFGGALPDWIVDDD